MQQVLVPSIRNTSVVDISSITPSKYTVFIYYVLGPCLYYVFGVSHTIFRQDMGKYGTDR